MPRQDGIRECREALEITKNTNPKKKPPEEILTQLLVVVLKNNVAEPITGQLVEQINKTDL